MGRSTFISKLNSLGLVQIKRCVLCGRTPSFWIFIHQQFKIFYLRYFAPKKLITCVKKSIRSEVNGPTFWKILGNIHFCGIPHSLSVLVFWLFLPNISNAYLTLICIHRVWRRNCCCLRRRLSCSMYFFRYVSTHTHFLPFGCLVKPCKRKIDWWKYIIKQYEYAQQQQQRAREKKIWVCILRLFLDQCSRQVSSRHSNSFVYLLLVCIQNQCEREPMYV